MKKVVLSSSLNKRLISRLMSSRPTDNTTKTFNLKGSSEFVSRSNNVFGELKALEVAHESWISTNPTNEYLPEEKVLENYQFVKPSNCVNQTVDNVRQNRKSKSDFLFKKPKVPNIRGRKNNTSRKKWIKYSLEDVPLSSNSTNASTALSFIDELRKRKSASPAISDSNEKLLFSKPRLINSSNRPSKSKNRSIPSSSGSLIKLNHLESDD